MNANYNCKVIKHVLTLTFLNHALLQSGNNSRFNLYLMKNIQLCKLCFRDEFRLLHGYVIFFTENVSDETFVAVLRET